MSRDGRVAPGTRRPRIRETGRDAAKRPARGTVR